MRELDRKGLAGQPVQRVKDVLLIQTKADGLQRPAKVDFGSTAQRRKNRHAELEIALGVLYARTHICPFNELYTK